MQKQVSKQSLAIIALSILLAICMALTATYAGFVSTKTVTGSIQFTNPNIALVLVGDTSASQVTQDTETGAITFTLGAEDFVMSTEEGVDKITLNATAKAAIESIGYYIATTGNDAFNLGSAASYNVVFAMESNDFEGLIVENSAADKSGQTTAVGTAETPIQLFTVEKINAKNISVTDKSITVTATLVRA